MPVSATFNIGDLSPHLEDYVEDPLDLSEILLKKAKLMQGMTHKRVPKI